MSTPFLTWPFAATGAPALRTLPDRLADVVNVRDYGALGNWDPHNPSLVDDSDAFEAAIEAAFPGSSNGSRNQRTGVTVRPLYIPAGSYRVSRTLYIRNVFGAHVYGDGGASTSITYYGGSFSGNTDAPAMDYDRVLFTVSGISVAPTQTAVYTSPNGQKYRVRSIGGGNTSLDCWHVNPSNTAPASSGSADASGALTKVSGTGDNLITYSAVNNSYSGFPNRSMVGSTGFSGSASEPNVGAGHPSANFPLAKDVTPLLMLTGVAISKFEGLTLYITHATNACASLVIYQDAQQFNSQCNGNLFTNMSFGAPSSAGQNNYGVLIGYGSDALCSESTFTNCYATNCNIGYLIASQNSLNNLFIGGGPSSNEVGIYARTGDFSGYRLSTNNNNSATSVDFTAFEGAVGLYNIRTESLNFFRPVSSQDTVHSVFGSYQAAWTGGDGYFVNLGSGGCVMLVGCGNLDPNDSHGLIKGTTNATVWMHGCGWLGSGAHDYAMFAQFTGKLAHLDYPYGSNNVYTVATLPPAAAKFKGLRASVSDLDTTTTFNTNVSGHGGSTNFMPVFCDGAAWRIG